jgi:hypothetical protein
LVFFVNTIFYISQFFVLSFLDIFNFIAGILIDLEEFLNDLGSPLLLLIFDIIVFIFIRCWYAYYFFLDSFLYFWALVFIFIESLIEPEMNTKIVRCDIG